ncbi:MAG: rhodanese-like domain-containing protein, partial [Gemmatimonadaceae bacterium]|nr:rhodanese-like domain-containing protein [Chitinophagaceae bacterium]
MKANRIATLLLLMILSTLTSAGQAIKPDEFEKEIIKPAIQLLDVRTAAEYKTGYIKNALLADWTDQKQFEERTKYLDKKRPLYV